MFEFPEPYSKFPLAIYFTYGNVSFHVTLSIYLHLHCIYKASLVAQLVKNQPTMQESWVRSLGWEDALEKEMATQSSILAWEIPWRQKPGRLQSLTSQKSQLPLSTRGWNRLFLGP